MEKTARNSLSRTFLTTDSSTASLPQNGQCWIAKRMVDCRRAISRVIGWIHILYFYKVISEPLTWYTGRVSAFC
jgi:hypothetical protein